MVALFYLIFFLSGIAALLFETLWFYQMGLALGNSIWASGLVLAGFMGGLAVGNGLITHFDHRISRPVRLYVILEVTIGITGCAIVYLLPQLGPLLAPLFRFVSGVSWVLNPLRLTIAFLLLLIPSAAMGMTMPLLVAALSRHDPLFGRVLGRLYGWNTLGAMVGAVAGEAVLFQWFGIRGTAATAALLNATAALAAYCVARALDTGYQGVRRKVLSGRSSWRAIRFLAAAFLMGGFLLTLEVLWFRFLSLFLLGTSLAFALTLGVVLAGIGLGGLLGSRWLAIQPSAIRYLPAVSFGNGAACLLLYLGLDLVIRRFDGFSAARWYEMLELSIPLMFPVSLLSGVLFTLLGEALSQEVPRTARAAGLLTLANTTGASLGSLVAAFVLLPWFGVEASIRLIAVGYALVGLLLIFGGLRPTTRWQTIGLTVSGCLVFLTQLFFPSGIMQRRYLRYPIKQYGVRMGEFPVAIREGLTETIIYLRREWLGTPLYHRLVTNAYSMSATTVNAQRYMKLFVYLPMALHPHPQHALLLCYGVGSTAKALTETKDLQTIDVVDTSRDILEMSRVMYPTRDEVPLADSRVRVYVEDGRFFLQTTNRFYDLITGEPPPPKMAGVVSLYTREYFQLIRDHLSEGGIATYWLPVHSLSMADGQAILAAFCDVFNDCSLWTGAGFDWVLMGTRGARGPVSEERFVHQWHDPVVGPELKAIGVEIPEQLGALFLADARDLQHLIGAAAPLSDDFPKRLSPVMKPRAQVQAAYRPQMDIEVTKAHFLNSPLIRHLWPDSLRAASLPYFSVQQTINRYFCQELDGVASEMPRIHHLLTHSSLATLVLWMFNSGADEQRAVTAAVARGWSDPDLNYHRGVAALAERQYDRAAQYFHQARGSGGGQREVLYLELYALCLTGRTQEAGQLLSRMVSSTEEVGRNQPFIQFLSDTFGLKLLP